MSSFVHPLGGVYAAAVTPIADDLSLIRDSIPELLGFLARRGCDGALLMGTTGEGPSLSMVEREQILKAGVLVRQDYSNFRLLAGTGTPSLEDTISLTRTAFDYGFEGVVVLPPYYYRNASFSGLLTWFRTVIKKAVPENGSLFGYHIPATSGVPLSAELLLRLRDEFPTRICGLKDSSGDPEHTRQICLQMGADFLVMVGNDRWFSQGLQDGASGCITALANLASPELASIWQGWINNQPTHDDQMRLDHLRILLNRNQPSAPYLKILLSRLYQFPHWSCKPPMLPISEDHADRLEQEFISVYYGNTA